MNTPRTDAERQRCIFVRGLAPEFEKHPQGSWVLAEKCAEIEQELAASHAREQGLRDSLESIKEYWNHAPESAVDAIETAEGRAADALSLPPPPVVSKAEYDRLAAELDREQRRTSASTVIGTKNVIISRLEAQLAAAEQDAERLAEVAALAFKDDLSNEDVDFINQALSAHEARKTPKP